MIERLLAADAALERDDLDAAEKLFVQVADADPRNAIAAVGLGRVAAGRDDAKGARTWFQRALEIDPDEAAALRLLQALDREVPDAGPVSAATATVATTAAAPPTTAAASATTAAAPAPTVATAATRGAAASPRRSILDRLRAWLGLGSSGRGR